MVVVVEGDRAEVGGLFVEHEGFVDESAWGDDLGHSAFDDAFGFFGVFELIDDGDSVSGVDGFLEVVGFLVVGDSGEGDRGSAFGEGESEVSSEVGRVVSEEFVEVTHAEEEDTLWVFFLDRGPLPHCRSVPGVLCHRGARIARRGWVSGRKAGLWRGIP